MVLNREKGLYENGDAFRGVPIGERLINANGVELCTESFGDPDDPPVLLVAGLSSSMLWWPEGFCRLLAKRGRLVIRYRRRFRPWRRSG